MTTLWSGPTWQRPGGWSTRPWRTSRANSGLTLGTKACNRRSLRSGFSTTPTPIPTRRTEAAMAAMAEAGAGQASGQRGGGSRTMRAAVLHGHGQPPEYGRHPVPRRAGGQALIRVSAAPVNPLDLLLASGTSYFGAPTLPYVPGTQGVGVIEQADTLTPGQRVWFSGSAGLSPGDGTLAELCVVDENGVVPLPETVSDDLVAALGLSAIAAWMALTWRGGIPAGEHVLVLGGSGTLSVLGYTNNAVRPEQRAAALTEILGHAAVGRLQVDRERLPLAEIAAGWARCGKAPHRRAVMIPP